MMVGVTMVMAILGWQIRCVAMGVHNRDQLIHHVMLLLLLLSTVGRHGRRTILPIPSRIQ